MTIVTYHPSTSLHFAHAKPETPARQVAAYLDPFGGYVSRIGGRRFLQAWLIQQAMILDGLQYPFPLTTAIVADAQELRRSDDV